MSFHSLNLSPELLEAARGILEQYGKKPPENKNLQGDVDFPKEKNGKKKKKNGDDDDPDLEHPDTEKVTINPRMNESMDFAKYGGKLMKTYVTSDAVPGGRRQFNNVIEFASVKSANRFMEASKSYGVLDADVKQGRDRGRIVVAKMSDKGVPYKENAQGVDSANSKIRKGQMGEEADQTTNNYDQLKKFKRAVSVTKKKGAEADGEKKILRPKTTSEQLETPEERKREQMADKRRQKNAEMAAKRAEERAKMLRDRAVKTEESLDLLPESTANMFRSIVNAANPREKAEMVSGFAEKELDEKGKKRFQKILARVQSLSAAELDKLALELSLHKLPDAKREMMRKQIQKLDTTGKGFNIGTQMSPVFENLDERELTDAEKQKKEEIVKALKRDHPDMDKSRMYAIATDRAKKYVSESNEVSLLIESLLVEDSEAVVKQFENVVRDMSNSAFWQFVDKAAPIIQKFDSARNGAHWKMKVAKIIKAEAKKRTRDEATALKRVNALYKKVNVPEIESLDEDIQLSEELYDYPRTNYVNTVPAIQEPYKSKRGMWTTTVDQEHNHDFSYGAGYTNSVHGHTHQIKYDEKGNPVILGGGKNPHSHKVKGKLNESEEQPDTGKIDPIPEQKPYRSLESTIRQMLNKR